MIDIGTAYLKDGTTMDYSEYISKHPHWQKVRSARLRFDAGKCCVCHRDVGSNFETHHLFYDHLGNEHLTDVVTMCPKCHTKFHNAWTRQSYWRGREKGHWEAFNLEHTSNMCLMFYKDDRILSKNPEAPNLCNRDTCRQYVDDYFKYCNITDPVSIDPNDLQLFVRNKRYEMWFYYEDAGETMESFLDKCFGEKVRGKNPIRRDAGQFFTKHRPKRYRSLYKENKNINELMKKVKEMEDFKR